MISQVSRRTALRLATAGLGSVAAGRSGFAQAGYPNRPIVLVNPYAAGSPVDFVARLMADRLKPILNGTILVESRAGAGGTLGTAYVAKAPADGYTLLVTTPSVLTVAPKLYKSLPYDADADFIPLWSLSSAGLVLVVTPSLPVQTVAEFIAYAKANPGKLTYGSAGRGSPQHIAAELFKRRAGIDLIHVPYRGAAPALTDLVAGQVQVMFDNVGNILSHVEGRSVRPLAILRAKRAQALPDVPAVSEAGVQGAEVPGAISLFAPRGTPPDVVALLETSAMQAMSSPDVLSRLLAAGNGTDMIAGAEFARQVAEESAFFARVVPELGISPE